MNRKFNAQRECTIEQCTLYTDPNKFYYVHTGLNNVLVEEKDVKNHDPKTCKLSQTMKVKLLENSTNTNENQYGFVKRFM